jgi:hypothetical protein
VLARAGHQLDQSVRDEYAALAVNGHLLSGYRRLRGDRTRGAGTNRGVRRNELFGIAIPPISLHWQFL